jgi:DNA repair exonuclease SbcCD ATPase subunit
MVTQIANRALWILIPSLVLSLIFGSCSTSNSRWQALRKFQNNQNQLIQQTSDVSTKIELCSIVLDSIKAFAQDQRVGWQFDSVAYVTTIWKLKREVLEYERDYSQLKAIEETSEHTLGMVHDYDVRATACDNVINAIEGFLQKYPEAQVKTVLITSLDAWKARKGELSAEFTSLLDQFGKATRERASKAAVSRHGLSHIESMEFKNREKSNEGVNLKVADTYIIRMKGNVLGTSIFKLKIIVSGFIALDTKRITIDSSPSIEE